MKALTISVAAYNAEAFLARCLDSFMADDFSGRLEVLVINDGSTDGTASIAKRYEKARPDIFRLITKENGGHGSTINTGLRCAAGKYFKPVDADDWLDTDNLRCLLERLETTDASMIIADYAEDYQMSGQSIINGAPMLPAERLTRYESYAGKKVLCMHHLFYRTDFLREKSFTVTEHIYYDDVEYTAYPLSRVRDFLYVPRVVYHYQLEVSGQSVSEEGFLKHQGDLRRVTENLFRAYRLYRGDSAGKRSLLVQASACLDSFHNRMFKVSRGGRGKNRGELAFYARMFTLAPEVFCHCVLRNKVFLLRLLSFFMLDRAVFSLMELWHSRVTRL